VRETVLIGFADALAAPECAFSLIDAGYDVIAFARQSSKPPLRYVKGIRVIEITSPELDAMAAAKDIAAAASTYGAVAIMPVDDVALWLCAEIELADSTAQIVGPTKSSALLALDKRLQLDVAIEAGFAVPETRALEQAGALAGVDPPVVLKGALAVALIGHRLSRAPTYHCGTTDEITAALAEWPSEQPLLVQAAIEGRGEGIFGLAVQGQIHGASAHERVRMMNPRGSGSSACRSRPLRVGDLAAAERFIERAQWTGLFMIELLRKGDGDAVFMELNGRAWGSMALARHLGLEYPAWAVRQVLDPSFTPPDVAYRDVLSRHAGRELVHLLYVLHGPRGARPAGWPTRVRTARDVLRLSSDDTWYNRRTGEVGLFLADTFRTVATQLRRRKGPR
jgi:predicted ATP-grasp superfamily ATP-dependent carboligase